MIFDPIISCLVVYLVAVNVPVIVAVLTGKYFEVQTGHFNIYQPMVRTIFNFVARSVVMVAKTAGDPDNESNRDLLAKTEKSR
jgi:hypothetical protein